MAKSTALIWIISMCKGYKRNIAIIISAITMILLVGFGIDDFYVKDIVINNNSFTYELGAGYVVVLFSTAAIILYGTTLLIRSIITQTGLVRKKLLIITAGIVSYVLAALLTVVLLPALNIIPYSLLDIPETLLFIVPAAFAMIKYKA